MTDSSGRPENGYSARTIKRYIEQSREHDAAASRGWHQSHGCIIDKDGFFLDPTGPEKNLFKGNLAGDPLRERANARAAVFARGAMKHYANMLEDLLTLVNEMAKYGQHEPYCHEIHGDPGTCDCGWNEVKSRFGQLNRFNDISEAKGE